MAEKFTRILDATSRYTGEVSSALGGQQSGDSHSHSHNPSPPSHKEASPSVHDEGSHSSQDSHTPAGHKSARDRIIDKMGAHMCG